MMINFNRYLFLVLSGFILLAFISVKLAFLFIGLYFFLIALFLKYQFYMLNKWQKFNGTIIEKKIEKDCRANVVFANRGRCEYFANIKYYYEVDGVKKHSTNISIYKNDFITPDKKELEKRLRKIKKDMPITVYVHPGNAKSVLFTEMFSGAIFYFYLNLLLGASLIVISFLMSY